MNVDLLSTPAEFVEDVRATFRAHVPESDAWVQPNFFSISSTVIGGLAWSAVNEAVNGVNARMNPQTAIGDDLAALAALPPLFLQRLAATPAEGLVTVDLSETVETLAVGEVFESTTGNTYVVTAIEAADESGSVVIATVQSEGTGLDQNSLAGQPLTSEIEAAVVTSNGITGGYDVETDDQLRRRMYATRSKFHFFGSACSYEDVLLGVRGVSRVWAYEDGGVAKIAFLMEDKYQCGVPTDEDIAEIVEMFKEECLTPMFFCPSFVAACSLTIAPEIIWTEEPEDKCDIVAAINQWLRENYTLGDGVDGCDLEAFLRGQYPEYGIRLACKDGWNGVPCCVYNCAELLGC